MQSDLVNKGENGKDVPMGPVDFDDRFLEDVHKKALQMHAESRNEDVLSAPFESITIKIVKVGEEAGEEFKTLSFPDIEGEVRLY